MPSWTQSPQRRWKSRACAIIVLLFLSRHSFVPERESYREGGNELAPKSPRRNPTSLSRWRWASVNEKEAECFETKHPTAINNPRLLVLGLQFSTVLVQPPQHRGFSILGGRTSSGRGWRGESGKGAGRIGQAG